MMRPTPWIGRLGQSTSRLLVWISSTLLLLAFGCKAPGPDGSQPGSATDAADSIPSWRSVDVPSMPQALAPELGLGEEGPVLSWLEPRTEEEGGGHRLRYAAWQGDGWGQPLDIIEDPSIFANWADRPTLQLLPGGALVASWLEKLGDDTYAYGIQLATSETPREGPWVRRGLLHEDVSATEHGFVSWAPTAAGVHAFWLDGQTMAGGGDMQLRTTFLAASLATDSAEVPAGPPESTLLDARVCECCATDAAMGVDGPLVVYRDRSPDEVRNIYIVRRLGDGWSAPQRIHDDGWRIEGCPVNGPVVGSVGRRVAVAWFTVVGGASRVHLAWSDDGGATFSEPQIVDGNEPLGRLDLVMQDEDSVWLSWLGTTDNGAEVHVQHLYADGRRDPPMTVAQVSVQRSAGVPRLLGDGQRLYLAWRQDGELAGLQSAVLELEGGG